MDFLNQILAFMESDEYYVAALTLLFSGFIGFITQRVALYLRARQRAARPGYAERMQ